MALVSTSIESFSIAALEAMALAKPMLMSEVGGAAEQIEPGRHGDLFPPHDVKSLADRLQEMADPALCARMGAAARRRVEQRFSEQDMRRRYVDLIDDLVPGQPLESAVS